MREVVGDEAAPEGEVDHRRRLCRLHLRRERLGSRGGWHRIERHLHRSGYPAGGRGATAWPPSFPMGAAGFVEVHVEIDGAGQHDAVLRVNDIIPLQGIGRNRGDATVVNPEAAADGPIRCDDQAVCDNPLIAHRIPRAFGTGCGYGTFGAGGGPDDWTGGASPMRSSGRTGTRLSSRPVASRSAARMAAVETMVDGSPAPLAPYGTPGSGSSMSTEMTGGMSRMVGIR